jgi:YidC/Oxa1 family membrane protein insertase
MWDALIITPFTNVLLFIYQVTGQNFGIAIILFTILIRLVTHPLTVQQMKGTTGMQKLQTDPRFKEMQEKYKDDREKLAQEQMKLYKELGINPFASCLPLIIQFPIIIGLYQTIIQAMSNTPLDMLRLARHIWPQVLDFNSVIPLNSTFLWMNLGQPERLNIPFLNFGIPILAVVVMITTYMQSKLLAPPSANPKDQTAQMTGMMNIYMPFFMGYLALTLASGLSLYFVVSNVVGILQYAILGKANWKSLIPTLPSFKPGEKPGGGKGSEKKSTPKPESQGKQPNRGKNESRKNNAGNNRANSR